MLTDARAVRQVRDDLKAAATAAGGAATAAYAGVAGVSGVAGDHLRGAATAAYAGVAGVSGVAGERLRGAVLFLSGAALSLCSRIASKVGSLVQKSFQTEETTSKKPKAKGRKEKS